MDNVCQYFIGQNQLAARSHGFLAADSGAPVHTVRACSSCAGDYEDPDRTAWPAGLDEEEAEDESGPQIHVEENSSATEDANVRNAFDRQELSCVTSETGQGRRQTNAAEKEKNDSGTNPEAAGSDS